MSNDHPNHGRAFLFLTTVLIILVASGCNSLRPQISLPADQQSSIYVPPTLSSSSSTPTPDSNSKNAQPSGCKNDLAFLKDMTIPDGTYITPGTSLDKQWKVKNTGTCNWDENYSLRLVSGPDLGVKGAQAITPLRADTEGTLRIVFTAPDEPGDYYAVWQAYDPDGNEFGEILTIEVNVFSQ